LRYLTENWMKNKPSSAQAENITINGMPAATAAFAGTANGTPVIIRVVAIQWKPGQFFRFQMAIPQAAGTAAVENMKRTTYSFRAMSESERASVHALKVRTFTAASESLAQAAARMAFPSHKEERFAVLNGLGGDGLTSGQIYKVITE
jgi:predicted Zn-dependent protease